MHHHAGALVESQMVGRAHVEDAMRTGQVAYALDGIAQALAEFLAARLALLQCLWNRRGQLQAGIPGMAAESRYAAGTVSLFIGGLVGQG